MSVNYTSYLYLGIKLSKHLKIDVEKFEYLKFDPKTGKKTNENVVEKTIYTLKIGNKEITQEVEGTGKLRYHEEIYQELLGIEYSDKDGLTICMDYENPEESVFGFQLFGSSENGKNSFTMKELEEKSKELKQVIKNKIGLDIEPEIHSLMQVG